MLIRIKFTVFGLLIINGFVAQTKPINHTFPVNESSKMVESNSKTTNKPFPNGLYQSGSPVFNAYDDAVSRAALIEGQEGVLVRVKWNICGNDINCLIDTITINLNTAESLGLKVALAVADGHHVPEQVKNDCELFPFTFRNEQHSMCEVWDKNYLAAKNTLIQLLGENFDHHPALAYIYFNTACSTNGLEGHCRIDLIDYTEAGYVDSVFDSTYASIMQFYLNAFENTPIVFEAHTVFDRMGMWESLWNVAMSSHRVGVAVWWCSERLSLHGEETQPAWSLVQQIAASSFAVCQTVGQFTQEPYRFTDLSLGDAFDYGLENDWDQLDVTQAFSDTLAWISGYKIHGNQTTNISPFSVLEAWTQDLQNVELQADLGIVLDISDIIFNHGFE